MFGFGKKKRRTMNEEDEKKSPEAEAASPAEPLSEAASSEAEPAPEQCIVFDADKWECAPHCRT